MAEVALPNAVRYGQMLPDAVAGTQTLNRFDAVNGSTFSNDGANEIRINISAPGFLLGHQAELHFDLKNNDTTNDLNTNGRASCVFDQLRIESNGVELERIEHYGLLDYLMSAYEGNLAGQAAGSFAGGPTPAATLAGTGGTTIGEGAVASFSIKFRSGFLNNKLKKAIPLLGTNGITLIMRMNPSAIESVIAAAGTISSISVLNPRVYCPVFQITDSNFAQRYQSMLGQMGIEWCGISFKRYTNALPAVTGDVVGQINDRSISLRGLLTAIRTNANIIDADKNSFATQIANISKYVYRINGQQYPLGGVDYSATDPARAYSEVAKLLGTYDELRGSVDKSVFVATDTTGLGVLAVDLKKYDDRSVNLTGLATAASTMPSTLEVTKLGAGDASTMVTFAICDAIYKLDNTGAFSVQM
jgi:hypothetical protein